MTTLFNKVQQSIKEELGCLNFFIEAIEEDLTHMKEGDNRFKDALCAGIVQYKSSLYGTCVDEASKYFRVTKTKNGYLILVFRHTNLKPTISNCTASIRIK